MPDRSSVETEIAALRATKSRRMHGEDTTWTLRLLEDILEKIKASEAPA